MGGLVFSGEYVVDLEHYRSLMDVNFYFLKLYIYGKLEKTA